MVKTPRTTPRASKPHRKSRAVSPAPSARTDPKKAALAEGRSLADFKPLLTAEDSLLASCRKGGIAILAAHPPEAPTAANTIRADFLRFLLLGGDADAPVHERGVRLAGAWIEGTLDLSYASSNLPLLLSYCRLDRVIARHSDNKMLSFAGCLIEKGFLGDMMKCGTFGLRNRSIVRGGLSLIGAKISGSLLLGNSSFINPGSGAVVGDGAEIGGTVFLDQGAYVFGETRFVGAVIRDAMTCTGSKFRNPRADAISLDRAHIGGSLFFNEEFFATGSVRMNGTRIGSNLELIEGHIENRRGTALEFERATVDDSFIISEGSKLSGQVNLSEMTVTVLSDASGVWSAARGKLILDGFRYGRFSGPMAAVDANTRIRWLELQIQQHLSDDFRPQPWEQLASVLRDSGHPEEARRVAIAKHRRMRAAGRFVGGSGAWDWLYGFLVGYGYRPSRLLGITFLVWAICTTAYWAAVNPQWFGSSQHLLQPKEAACNRSTAGGEICTNPHVRYEDFFVPAFSAEVLIPVITLGYKGKWEPVVSAPDGRVLGWGWAIRLIYWAEIFFGWLASLMLIAAVGNLVKKE